jgi:EAL domain-containing protein (putative c-di-GMP-specific phosphodiesterase class I)/GGDEF domain-containing protein
VADPDDLSTMDSMISAIFDSGYYESITLYDTEDKILLQNKQPVVVKDVPQWFMDFVDFEVPVAETQIMAGWFPMGKLVIKGHAGYGYNQLWIAFKETITSVAIWLAVSFIVLYIVLSFILKALKNIQRQAIGISENEFIKVEQMPYTTEFKEVTVAMNSMVDKVEEIFNKEKESFKKYQDLLYTDQDTKLWNRRYFMVELNNYLEAQDFHSNGSIAFISINGFSKIKEQIGFKAMQDMLFSMIDTTKEHTKDINGLLLARMNNTDFALIIPNRDFTELKDDFDKLLDSYKEIFSQHDFDNDIYVDMAVACYTHNDSIKDILSRLDFTLSEAKLRKDFCVVYAKTCGDKVLGKDEWRDKIKKSIEEGNFKIALQSILNEESGIYHKEAYMRLQDGEKILSAGAFISVLVSLGMMDKVEKHILSLIFEYVQKSGESVSVNIGIEFISDTENIAWLREKLRETKTKIYFEINNSAILKNLELFKEFSGLVRAFKHSVGIDNFSVSGGDLSYLQELKPSFIKVNQNTLLDMDSSSSEALNIISKSLGISIVATAVESDVQKHKLEDIEVHLFQGRGISDIKLVGEKE